MKKILFSILFVLLVSCGALAYFGFSPFDVHGQDICPEQKRRKKILDVKRRVVYNVDSARVLASAPRPRLARA